MERYKDDTRIADALDGLNRKGFIARSNYSCCQSCGGVEIVAEAAERKRAPRYYVFWHQQDEEGRWTDGDVYLAYGCLDEAATPEQTREAGRQIVAHLKSHGIRCEWSGSSASRIRAIGNDREPA